MHSVLIRAAAATSKRLTKFPSIVVSSSAARPLNLSLRAFASAPTPTSSSSKSESKQEAEEEEGGSNSILLWSVAGAAAAGLGYYFYSSGSNNAKAKSLSAALPLTTQEDYQKVYNAISDLLTSNSDYDDGSYGPVLVRLAWHAAGTFDKATGTGGSNGATMRFAPESEHGANAGLSVARDLLEKVKKQFPAISYADLWSLAGVVAIQEMGGPSIKWRPGRSDLTAESVTPDGRLPDATKKQDHLRQIFGRMGFNDQEIVALSGAHALGRCHTDRSGFTGPWTFSPTTFSNSYFKLLLSEKWNEKKWTGPKQYEDKKTQSLMMLPSDLALYNDWTFYRYVKKYAADEKLFFADFAAAFQKLEELGVPFKPDTPTFEFKRS